MDLKYSNHSIKYKCIKLIPLLYFSKLYDYRGFNLWLKSIEQFADYFGCLQLISPNAELFTNQIDYFEDKFNFLKMILLQTTNTCFHNHFKNQASINMMINTIRTLISMQVPFNEYKSELINLDKNNIKFNNWKWNADEKKLFFHQLIRFSFAEQTRGNYSLHFNKEYRDLFVFDENRMCLIVDYLNSVDYFEKYHQILLSEFLNPSNLRDINNNNIEKFNSRMNSNYNSISSLIKSLNPLSANRMNTSSVLSNSFANQSNNQTIDRSNLKSNSFANHFNQTTNASNLISNSFTNQLYSINAANLLSNTQSNEYNQNVSASDLVLDHIENQTYSTYDLKSNQIKNQSFSASNLLSNSSIDSSIYNENSIIQQRKSYDDKSILDSRSLNLLNPFSTTKKSNLKRKESAKRQVDCLENIDPFIKSIDKEFKRFKIDL